MDAELKERALRTWQRLVGNPEHDVEVLATLLADLRAEAEARVVEAAAGIVSARIDSASVAFGAGSDAVRSLTDALLRIRALAPADYVAVRRETLQAVIDARSINSLLFQQACYIIRAALAQKEIP